MFVLIVLLIRSCSLPHHHHAVLSAPRRLFFHSLQHPQYLDFKVRHPRFRRDLPVTNLCAIVRVLDRIGGGGLARG